MVEWLFLAVPWGCLLFVIVVIPDHTHLLLLNALCLCQAFTLSFVALTFFFVIYSKKKAVEGCWLTYKLNYDKILALTCPAAEES